MHRDIKPHNIFLRIVESKLVIKLGDFGIARKTPNSKVLHSNLTQNKGTDAYMAPELH